METLAADPQDIWSAPTTDARLKKRIVRTLIQGELSGSIDWHTLAGQGTEVTIEIPLRYIEREVG